MVSKLKSGGDALSKFKLTDEQEMAIALAETGDTLKIEAFAGAGKTSTLRAIGASTKRRGMYLAFNRAIADEASRTFPNNVTSKSTHQLAYREVGAHFKDQGRLLNRIPGDAMIQGLGLYEWRGVSPRKIARLSLSTLSRFCHSSDRGITTRHVPHDEAEIIAGDVMDILEVKEHISSIAKLAWCRMSDLKGKFPIDHETYLKLWALSDPKIQVDFILYDEAQDANPLILDVLMKQKAQIIFVGDQYQQIYSWRGAVNAMKNFQSDRVSYLTQSFRFGENIASIANEVIQGLLGCPHKIRGNPSVNDLVTNKERVVSAILCRTNAEVIKNLTRQLEEGMRVGIQGGTTEMRNLIKGVMDLKDGRLPSSQELQLFSSYDDFLEYAEGESGGEYKTILSLIENYGAQGLLDVLAQATNEKSDHIDVIISTTHKAKGREWESVRVAGDFRGPNHPSYRAEEANLFYVALTRAKKILDISDCESILKEIRELSREKPEIDSKIPEETIESISLNSSEKSKLDKEEMSDEDNFIWEALFDDEDKFSHAKPRNTKTKKAKPEALSLRKPPEALKPEEKDSKAGAKKQPLEGEKALAAKSFLARAQLEGRDTILKGSPELAWAAYKMVHTDEELNLWIDSYMTPKGRSRMLATLRQQKFHQKIRRIDIREEVADDLSELAEKSGLNISDFVERLLMLHKGLYYRGSDKEVRL